MAPGYRHGGLDALFALAAASPLRPERDRFIFVRHGETEGNRLKIFQRADQELNAAGIAQAEAAARALADLRLERIAASTMDRAWVTAEIVARPHGVAPVPMDDLRERWFGDLVGTPAAGYDWRKAPPNGETLETFVTRTRRGLASALGQDDRLAIVAHGGTLYVLGPLLGVELAPELYANATPLLFERTGSRWRASAIAGGGRAGNIS